MKPMPPPPIRSFSQYPHLLVWQLICRKRIFPDICIYSHDSTCMQKGIFPNSCIYSYSNVYMQIRYISPMPAFTRMTVLVCRKGLFPNTCIYSNDSRRVHFLDVLELRCRILSLKHQGVKSYYRPGYLLCGRLLNWEKQALEITNGLIRCNTPNTFIYSYDSDNADSV